MFSKSKMDQVTAIIRKYNAAVTQKLKFSLNQLTPRLHKMGATEDEDLMGMSFEQWQSIGLPEIVAKKVAMACRGKASGPETYSALSPGGGVVHLVTASEQAAELNNQQLVERFAMNPKSLYGPIPEQLRARSGNRPCIAYNGDSINIEATVIALDSFQEGEDPGEFVRVGDKPFYLYVVGATPGNLRREHPVFPGRNMRRDNRTDEFGVDWGEIPENVQQLIREAVLTREIRIDPPTSEQEKQIVRRKLIRLRDIARSGTVSLAERYPDAARQFMDKKDIGGLASLVIRTQQAPRGASAGTLMSAGLSHN